MKNIHHLGKHALAICCAAACVMSGAALAGDDKLKRMDANGDGIVSSSEHATGAKAMFTEIDANQDSSIAVAEMDAYLAAKDESHSGGLTSADRIARIDTDGDGRVSVAEHEVGSAEMFSKIDADADGNLTAMEWKEGHDKLMKDDAKVASDDRAE